MKRFDSLDGLKGIAILLIVVSHAGLLPRNWILHWAAVCLFFVLSGFTSFRSFQPDRFNLRKYYLKRLRNLYGLYFAALVISFAVAYYVQQPLPKGSLFLHLFMLQSLDYSISIAPNNALWFITPLVEFYLVYPFLAHCAFRFPKTFFAIALPVALAFQFINPSWTAYYINLPYLLLPFLAGMFAAQYGREFKYSTVGQAAGFTAFAIYGIYFKAIGAAFVPLAPRGLIVSAICVLLVISLCQSKLLTVKPLRYAGLYSFPIFLFHCPLLSLIFYLR